MIDIAQDEMSEYVKKLLNTFTKRYGNIESVQDMNNFKNFLRKRWARMLEDNWEVFFCANRYMDYEFEPKNRPKFLGSEEEWKELVSKKRDEFFEVFGNPKRGKRMQEIDDYLPLLREKAMEILGMPKCSREEMVV